MSQGRKAESVYLSFVPHSIGHAYQKKLTFFSDTKSDFVHRPSGGYRGEEIMLSYIGE